MGNNDVLNIIYLSINKNPNGTTFIAEKEYQNRDLKLTYLTTLVSDLKDNLRWMREGNEMMRPFYTKVVDDIIRDIAFLSGWITEVAYVYKKT